MELKLIIGSIILLINFYFFGLQRTTLELSRTTGVDFNVLLPKWFILNWVVFFAKWGITVWIAFSSIGWAVGLMISSYILCSYLPIPYSWYKSMLVKNAKNVRSYDYEVGALFINKMKEVGFIK